ncbi:MAG: FAD-dependent monooxygenase [Mesorhizobium sp.]|uniref:FAD-dependent monooxygenase n=1 Tax=Mesorhizobium sp. TaxID=1871066 RepID=UPI001AD414A8|nr:FAD-dependent monooxygenase [Mesorhizobium sp.]MBN9217532.1 FAD-dependent monooxygenase [Mesorhizobium sp.]
MPVSMPTNQPPRDHSVLIVGGGPTGLMLAGELALADIDVAIVERRPTQQLAGSRAGGLHARTIEVLDQRGIADRFLSQGKLWPAASFHMVRLDTSDFPSRHNYLLALRQNHIERIMADWIGELGVPIYREREVTGFAQDEDGVDLELSGGQRLRTQYLVGCDGGRSVIRKAAGIEFAGWDPTMSWIIAEVEMAREPEWGFRSDAHGVHAIGKIEESGRVGIVLTERQLTIGGEPTLLDLQQALDGIYGTDYGVHGPTWISRFTDMVRQATAYRDRRVVLAGDAAHIHPPMGGQGLNIGVQDAVNLGWKLARVVKGMSPESLLDSYHSERHPVAARVLRNSMAQVALRRMDVRTKALADTFAELLAMDEPRKRLAGEMSGLSVHYDLGEGHPLLGRRMPDLDLTTADGPLRVYSLMHDARPVLLNLGEAGSLDAGPWKEQLRQVDAAYDGAWELPVLGAVDAPAAVLIRPDGYVAWVSDATDWGLADALTKWLGLPVAS